MVALKVRRVGGAYGVILKKEQLDRVGATEGSMVEVEVRRLGEAALVPFTEDGDVIDLGTALAPTPAVEAEEAATLEEMLDMATSRERRDALHYLLSLYIGTKTFQELIDELT